MKSQEIINLDGRELRMCGILFAENLMVNPLEVVVVAVAVQIANAMEELFAVQEVAVVVVQIAAVPKLGKNRGRKAVVENRVRVSLSLGFDFYVNGIFSKFDFFSEIFWNLSFLLVFSLVLQSSLLDLLLVFTLVKMRNSKIFQNFPKNSKMTS